MNNFTIKTIQIAAVAVLALAPASAWAGRGGSAAKIRAAVASGSVDAIVAEVERTEKLICNECVDLVTALTEDSRWEVREVAAWWFAKRVAFKDMLVPGFLDDLASGGTTKVRNAADFLGRSKTRAAIPQLIAAQRRADLGYDARYALVRAAAKLKTLEANPLLTAAMSDGDPRVRAAAVTAWRDMRGQTNAQPVLPLLGDSDAEVRGQAAVVAGAMGEQSTRVTLETLVVRDPDATVRRNAAWALGRLHNPASSGALLLASGDPSGLVRGVARAALAELR